MGKIAVLPESTPMTLGGVSIKPGIHPVGNDTVEQASRDPMGRGHELGDGRVGLFDTLQEVEAHYDNDTLMSLIEYTLKEIEQKDGSMTSVIRRMQQLARGFAGNKEVIDFIRDYKRQFEGTDPLTEQEFTIQL